MVIKHCEIVDTPSIVDKLINTLAPYNISVVTFPQYRVQEGNGVSYYNNYSGNSTKCLNAWKSQVMDMTLLSTCHVVIAGQYSSFTQSMPLSIVLANTTTNITEVSKSWFCEVGMRGDVIKCFNNYAQWIQRTSALPLIGNITSPLQTFHPQTMFPFFSLDNSAQKMLSNGNHFTKWKSRKAH